MKQLPLKVHDLAFLWPGAEKCLFSGVSFEFVPGTVSAIMGANGSGKTTWLEVISQRLPAERGNVRAGDRPVLADDFNYLPQDSARLLFSHLTLADNIALQRDAGNASLPPMVRDLFREKETLARYPAQCSGGQRQRAVVCRAILDMPHFPVTLLDESFSQLSRDAKATLGPALRNTAKESGAIVVFVTHDLFDAMRFADQVLVLADGQLAGFDTSDVTSEEDCWKQVARREEILHRLRLSNGAIA